MADELVNSQTAPFPHKLIDLVGQLRYRRHLSWSVRVADIERDPASTHGAPSRGLTLIVQRVGPDTYHPEQLMRVNHYFPVPPASYNTASWQRWLFDRLGDVDRHERMEDFALATSSLGATEILHRPFAPNHGPGHDPYTVRELASETDRRTSFRGELNPDTP